jgi:monovalent cation:H+ antiporter-2, CPA2 family
MDFWFLLTDIGILLTAALVLGALFMKLKLNPLIGYLLAGVFLGGPGSLHFVKSPHEIEVISELGVALLLFSLGLEFSWNKIKTFSHSIIKAGILQVLVTPVIIFSIGLAFKLEFRLAIFLALALTLSSTATVLRSLIGQGEIDSAHGRNVTAVLLFQDIAVVPFTIIISLLISSGEAFEIKNLLFILISVLALVIGLYALLNKIAIPILSLFTLENNREMSILLAVVISIGSAWAAHRIGISPAIGAFLAGMILGSSSFATQITADVSPLRVVFLTLFFGSVGMVADPIWIANNIVFVLALTIAILVIKTIISFLVFKIMNNTIAISLSSAIIISQIGEFAFVLSTIAKDGKLISEDMHQILFSVTILSILMTALVIKDSSKIGLAIHKLFSKKSSGYIEEQTEEQSNAPKIFLLGFGPSGKEVGTLLKDGGYTNISVIDLNKTCLNDATAYGFKAYIGDIRQLEVLQHFGIAKAELVIITVPSQEAALQAIDNIRRLNPKAYIIVRSRYQVSVKSFEKAGAHAIINEETAVGKDLGEKSLGYLVNL